VIAPPRPSPDAQLEMAVEQHGLPPQALPGTVTFEKLLDESGYRGTINLRGTAGQLSEVGETVYVYWKGGPAWWAPKRYTFRVTIGLIDLLDDPTSTFSAFAYVNEKYASLLSGKPTPLGVQYNPHAAVHDIYCGPGHGSCTYPLQDNVFTVTVVDGQPLHVQVRGTAPHVIDFGTAYFLGSAEITYTGDPRGWAGQRTKEAIFANAVGPEDSDAACSGPCFSARVEVALVAYPAGSGP
jgi:hypothetical protein